MGLGIAFRSFWAALVSSDKAAALDAALTGEAADKQLTIPSPAADTRLPPAETKPAPSPKVSSHRSDALTLLATLQREARLIDLIQEDLSSYGDAEVGAAARSVIADSRKVLQRLFSIEPATSLGEGDVVAHDQIDGQQYRVVDGKSSASRYRVVHPGWKAARQDVPVWTGDPKSAHVIAPAEVEADA